mmetsp:Transcript_28786/g.92894  ORF Transcript_28786/g.92894 Transcript_28786/m.92894 type:complete len:207 (-) Transcript_28786:933-1553(-)
MKGSNRIAVRRVTQKHLILVDVGKILLFSCQQLLVALMRYLGQLLKFEFQRLIAFPGRREASDKVAAVPQVIFLLRLLPVLRLFLAPAHPHVPLGERGFEAWAVHIELLHTRSNQVGRLLVSTHRSLHLMKDLVVISTHLFIRNILASHFHPLPIFQLCVENAKRVGDQRLLDELVYHVLTVKGGRVVKLEQPWLQVSVHQNVHAK